MAETKWTPGPLKIAIGKYDVRVEKLDGRCTALTSDDWKTLDGSNPLHNNIGVDESIANAQLYAAAPDLYEALKETLEIAARHESGDYIERANASMRKARGE